METAILARNESKDDGSNLYDPFTPLLFWYTRIGYVPIPIFPTTNFAHFRITNSKNIGPFWRQIRRK
jgi:hypothetical protein